MEAKNKILKIVYCLSSLYKAGGMERVVTNKANYLARRGYDITIVTTDQKERPAYFKLDSTIQCIDLRINYEDSNGRSLLYKVLRYPKRLRRHRKQLEETVRRINADVVISLFDHEASFLWKLKDRSEKLLEIHFSRFKRMQYGKKGIWRIVNRYRSHLDLKNVKKYKHFIVLTEEDRGYWGDLKNIIVIPNANSFQPDSVSSLDQKVVIAVGRYDHQKRFEDLIQVWALIVSSFSDWELRIFGDGEQRIYLQGLIDHLDLNKTIKLCTPVEDIAKEYLNSSIAVLTSRYEGLPMALLEAQCCGLPLLSYACKCGPMDIIESGRNGFLITEGDVLAFAQKLRMLMDDSDLRQKMGKEAKIMSTRFAEDTIMQRWFNLFNG